MLKCCRHFAVLAGRDERSDLPWAMRLRERVIFDEEEAEEGKEEGEEIEIKVSMVKTRKERNVIEK